MRFEPKAMVHMNKQLKGSIFRMYPNIEQQILIEKGFGVSRYTHNYLFNKRISKFGNRKDKTNIDFIYYCSEYI